MIVREAMRVAVLSDIHGNLEALSAVMGALASDRIERYYCLGDIVGYGADPAACLGRLDECDAVMVAGNHDAACVGTLELSWFNEAARTALLWTREQLSVTDLDRLRRLPLTTTVEPFTLVHGTLTHPERFDYLVDLAQAIDTVTACQTLFCLIGHTHEACWLEYDRANRRIVRVATAADELGEVRFSTDGHARRYLLNPGSVGQPRDGDPRASVAVIDMEHTCVTIRRIPYDVAAAQRKIRDAGLPSVLADRLAIGR